MKEIIMTNERTLEQAYVGTAAENYERYFVPSIAAPLAADLIEVSTPRAGERALDVACGTGVVTRLAAQRVGAEGSVVGLDVNPGMLAVARSVTPKLAIDWREGSAEAIPFPDATFDVVLCQMGLQFVPNKLGALREMRRVLARAGRLVLNLPGPTPPLFDVLADALGRHIDARASSFVHIVFSLSDEQELRELMQGAGFHHVEVHRTTTKLGLPPIRDFLWQYVFSTPLADVVAKANEASRCALEREIADRWQEFAPDGSLTCEVGISTVSGR
ncbi:methyltransferase domain-containing protein [Ramlibacter rhizophilus]|uniref:methyltransferase domain-containing protein n=1 Tax=Ramlibacter rhizophilus TaxID=1781167 RepID=UPI001432462B|nr:methyltransferase domain-containing protein [Ramlibacter rhizophilus]